MHIAKIQISLCIPQSDQSLSFAPEEMLDPWLPIKWPSKTDQTAGIGNSYTMACPPVRGDNPRALASGLTYVQMDKHVITILYHLHQCRPCTSSDISC